MPGTLYTYPENFRAYKALVAAQYSGFSIKLSPDFTFGTTNKSETFLKKFPVGKVPVLETSDNLHLSESNAIAHYVGNEQLRGKNLKEQSLILQWINFIDNEIMPSASTWLFPILGYMQYNKQATENAKEILKKNLQILNDHLLTRTYLVGERITQADITAFCSLLLLYINVFEPSFRQPYGNVNRWFITLANQPQFKSVVGDVKLCDKMGQFCAEKYAEIQKKIQGNKDTGSAKKGKDKKQDKKSDEKKQAEQEVEEEMDETELILAADAKANAKDPFGKFAKGTFNMDEFKRVYSNEAETVSIKHFWNKFDSENYSIWFCEYLFPKDLSLVFMSCNLISGMFQRLDKMRKNAFASVILFGEDNNSTISGIWVWKGHELAFELCEDWQIDYESYSWKKLDPANEETKKLVNEYFAWSGDFGGKKFNQGKIFK